MLADPALRRAARIAALVVGADAATKALAVVALDGRDVALAGPLSLSLVYNDTFGRGADLGAATAPATFALTLAFVLLVAAVCAALARVDARAPRGLGLVGGAAIANAADFAHTGRGAVDFVAVATRDGAIVFNLADVAAYVGVLTLVGTVVALCRAIVTERRDAVVARAGASVRATPAVRATTSDVARPVPLFAEPSAIARAATADRPARIDVPSYPPAYPHTFLPAVDGPIDVAPPPGFER